MIMTIDLGEVRVIGRCCGGSVTLRPSLKDKYHHHDIIVAYGRLPLLKWMFFWKFSKMARGGNFQSENHIGVIMVFLMRHLTIVFRGNL